LYKGIGQVFFLKDQSPGIDTCIAQLHAQSEINIFNAISNNEQQVAPVTLTTM